MKLFIFLLSLLAVLSASRQQTVEINCTFTASERDYFCLLPRIEISDKTNQTIVFGGNHVSGRRNENVSHIFFEPVSKIPFVLVEMFTTFPNVTDVWMMDIGLTRVQSGAFANAKNLQSLYIRNNSRLTVIEANAFTGASKLEYMELSNNSIEVVHGSAFSRIESVRFLYLNENQIRKLPRNVFKSMKSLELLYLQKNSIETLDGRVLANNPNLSMAFFDNNRINAIGRTFLDGLESLEVLAIRGNNCVDDFFSVYESSTVKLIHKRLRKCFENYDNLDNAEIYTLELHGTISITDEKGNVMNLDNKYLSKFIET